MSYSAVIYDTYHGDSLDKVIPWDVQADYYGYYQIVTYVGGVSYLRNKAKSSGSSQHADPASSANAIWPPATYYIIWSAIR